MRTVLFMQLLMVLQLAVKGQHLQPGFQKDEFMELLKIGVQTSTDTSYIKKFSAPEKHRLAYQSKYIGFDNLWQLWISRDSVAVISVRGTTKTSISFLANLYAAMVAARGTIQVANDYNFKYNLSDDPKAAVHVGFLVSTAFLSRDIIPKIDSCYKVGIKEYIIAGHSQGAAITYLLTSYLENLKKEGVIPSDIRFKTCASAAPKPGNLYYAYSFEELTKNGWSYNVVNTVDWVPEVPFSIQTTKDMSTINPFEGAKKMIKKQKFPGNIALKYAYNKLDRPAKKAQKNYEKYLGKLVSKQVKKSLPGFKTPSYFSSNNYVRTGSTVLLTPDDSYFQKFKQNPDSIWNNHTHPPYIYLTEKLK